MKPKIDKELCIGCALCEEICPDVFEMDDGEEVAIVKEGSSCDDAGCCEEAKEECPVEAIALE